MKPSSLIAAAVAMSTVLVTAGPAAAQSAPEVPGAQTAPPAPSAANVRMQVRTMENVFITAIRGGLEQIASRMSQIAPGVTLVSGAPHAHGYAVEGHGWFFDVEVPELFWATIDLYSQLRPTTPASGQLPVGNTRRAPAVAANATDAPAEAAAPTRDDYRQAMREALLDAILDFGQVPLKANEFLTVGVRSSDSVGNDPESDTVALVLQISGEDLSLFRQQKISRDEAKKRIRINQQQR